MTTKHAVEAGQRYRVAGAPRTTLTVEWNVLGVYVPWQGGFEHARLRRVDPRAETMTLASSVVTDKTRSIRVH